MILIFVSVNIVAEAPGREGSNISNHQEKWERNLQGELTDMLPHLQALYDIGKEFDFVIFSKETNREEFVQFRLVFDDDYNKVIQLSVPHSDAVDSYRDKILNLVIEHDLPVESYLMEHEEHSMKMDHIIFDDDIEAATDFSKAVFEQIFDTVHDTPINIYRASGAENPSMLSKARYALGYVLGYCFAKVKGTGRN